MFEVIKPKVARETYRSSAPAFGEDGRRAAIPLIWRLCKKGPRRPAQLRLVGDLARRTAALPEGRAVTCPKAGQIL